MSSIGFLLGELRFGSQNSLHIVIPAVTGIRFRLPPSFPAFHYCLNLNPHGLSVAVTGIRFPLRPSFHCRLNHHGLNVHLDYDAQRFLLLQRRNGSQTMVSGRAPNYLHSSYHNDVKLMRLEVYLVTLLWLLLCVNWLCKNNAQVLARKTINQPNLVSDIEWHW